MSGRLITIGEEFWLDERLGKVSVGANLLYLGLASIADSKGVAVSDPDVIKSKVFFQHKGIRAYQVSRWLLELEDASLILRIDHSHYLVDSSEKRIAMLGTRETLNEENKCRWDYPDIHDEEFRELFSELLRTEKWSGKRRIVIESDLKELSMFDKDYAKSLVKTALNNPKYDKCVWPDTWGKYKKLKDSAEKEQSVIKGMMGVFKQNVSI